jgi:hypothetical protein
VRVETDRIFMVPRPQLQFKLSGKDQSYFNFDNQHCTYLI